MNIYLISGIVIFVIILSVSLYFGLRPNNKPLPSPNTCKNNLTQCGTGCYDKKWQSCDSEKQICDSQNFSQSNDTCCIFPETLHDKIQVDDKGNQKIVGNECCIDEYWSSSGNTCCPNPVCGGFCCENTKYCDYSIVDDNKKNHKNNNPCKVCPYDLCGQNCCASNEKCFTGPSGLISCCLPQLWDPDKKICCNGSTGAVIGINCHPGGNPKCNPSCNSQETCIAENVCCDDVYDGDKIYSCVDQDFNSICCPEDDIKNKCQALKNSQYICCGDGFSLDEKSQKCFQICGNEKCDPNLSSCVGSNEYKYCQTKGCIWDTNSNYEPPNYGDNIIFSYNGPNGLKYYYAKPINPDISKKLTRTITYTEIDKDNKCKETDCIGKINEEGASSTFHVDNHSCIGTYDNSSIQGFSSITDKPSPSCPSYGSCVMENGEPTGQICLNKLGKPQKAYNGPNKNSIGGIILNSGDCICNDTDNPQNDSCKKIDANNTFCPVPINSDFQGVLSLDTGNCSYLYNNNIFNNLNDLCANFDTDGSTYGRCYKISSNNYHTDKICNRGETCLLENNIYTCVNNGTYCGQYGTWDNVNKICNCINNEHAGNRCQYSAKDTCFNKGYPTGNGGSCPSDCIMGSDYGVSTNTQCNYYNDDVFNLSAYNCPSVDGSDPNQNPWHASEPISPVSGSSCGAFGVASEYHATCVRDKGCYN